MLAHHPPATKGSIRRPRTNDRRAGEVGPDCARQHAARRMCARSCPLRVDQKPKRVHDRSDGSIGRQGSRGFAGRMRLRVLHAMRGSTLFLAAALACGCNDNMASPSASEHSGTDDASDDDSTAAQDSPSGGCPVPPGVTKNSNGYWEKAALPSGSCSDAAPECSALIENPCPAHYPRGPLDVWVCSCRFGAWSCYIDSYGMAACPVEAGDQ
jgi:hypothetical protein